MKSNLPSTIERPKSPNAFTLVELLVVISIIGILIALLLPAVQAAREAARQVQCKNNLKQIALAALTHEQKYSYFPTAGWGNAWVGDPDRSPVPGKGWRQTGGWLYSCLPFLEQEPLYLLPADGDAKTITTQQKAGAKIVCQTPLSVLNCPTRRRAMAFPNWLGRSFYNADYCDVMVRSDYASNAGDTGLYGNPGPGTLASGDRGGDTDFDYRGYYGPNGSKGPPVLMTGTMYLCSEVKMGDITDGTSNTFLCGEKEVNPDGYFTGIQPSDDQYAFGGADIDTSRWTGYNGNACKSAAASGVVGWPTPDDQDPPGYVRVGYDVCFGSAHSNGFQMAFCDGSIQMMNYSIDLEIFRRLGNRKDGLAIDGKKF